MVVRRSAATAFMIARSDSGIRTLRATSLSALVFMEVSPVSGPAYVAAPANKDMLP
jgi:hypothetical protein